MCFLPNMESNTAVSFFYDTSQYFTAEWLCHLFIFLHHPNSSIPWYKIKEIWQSIEEYYWQVPNKQIPFDDVF